MDEQREDKQRAGHLRSDPAKEEFWRQRLDEQEASGLSVRAFCRREGFGDSLFYWWRREIARRGAPDVAEGQLKKLDGTDLPPSFAELLPAISAETAPAMREQRKPPSAPRARRTKSFSLPGAPASVAYDLRASSLTRGNSSVIEVVLSNGRALRVARGFDPDLLLEVTRLLEGEAPLC